MVLALGSSGDSEGTKWDKKETNKTAPGAGSVVSSHLDRCGKELQK